MKFVKKIAGYLPVSDELLAQAEEDRRAHEKWLSANEAQREQWRQEAIERRATERAETEHVELTLDALMTSQGWSREYAEHIVQPYCYCGPSMDDGWYPCQHAFDLGLEHE